MMPFFIFYMLEKKFQMNWFSNRLNSSNGPLKNRLVMVSREKKKWDIPNTFRKPHNLLANHNQIKQKTLNVQHI